ncbi:MAG: DUF389 domain-containing protein [Anaerolineae bacterium]|nr:DUF389 domain-containing protein [Anaerolineae bacterium]
MNIPNEMDPPLEPPPDSRISARARRRRARRNFLPKNAEGRAGVIATLARRAYPSYELFIYSVLCGAVLGVGFFVDSYGVLFLGILFAPLMIPWVGLVLSIITGTPRLFMQTFIGLLISALLIFATGMLAGFASRIFLPHTFDAAFRLSRLWWPNLIVMALGAIVLTVSFIRSESKPFLPSVIVAFGLFVPLSASGFGVGNGVGDLWPHGALVFVVHLAVATVFGLATLAVLRFRPLSKFGYLFASGIFLVIIFSVFVLIDPSKAQILEANLVSAALPTASQTEEPLPSETATSTAPASATSDVLSPTVTESTPDTNDETVTPVPLTLDITLPVTETRTSTIAPDPTPIYALIKSSQGGGAYIRKEPGGIVLATLDNGAIVQVLPGTQEYRGNFWIHVFITPNDIRVEGWIIQTVLETATPVPNWEPSVTSTPTP